MTTDVIKLPGDYKIKANNGTVTVDAPLTVINGNLTVLGTSTVIESIVATIKDNVIILNSGEVGPGVTLGSAGIVIDRGQNVASTSSPSLLFIEDFTSSAPWLPQPLRGKWRFGPAGSGYVGWTVELGSLIIPTTINTLTVFGSHNPLAVISVGGTNNYENQVINDDDIPNKKYVDDTLAAGTSFAQKLKVGNSFIEINSPDVLISSPFYGVVDKIFAALSTSSNVVFKLEGNDADIQGIRLNKNAASITVISTNTDLTLNAGGISNSTGTVIVNSAIRIANTPATLAKDDYTSVYSTSTVGGGGTGLYYVNNSDSDELVSRRRSIIYGIIF
jgi:hypothetical protein